LKLRALAVLALAGGCTSILGLREDQYASSADATCDAYGSYCSADLASGKMCTLGRDVADCKRFLGGKPEPFVSDSTGCIGFTDCTQFVSCASQRFKLRQCNDLRGKWNASFRGTFTDASGSAENTATAVFEFTGSSCTGDESAVVTFNAPNTGSPCAAGQIKVCGGTFSTPRAKCSFTNAAFGMVWLDTFATTGTITGDTWLMNVSGTFQNELPSSGTFVGTWTATRQ
jgi:hypothetical protein